MGCWWAACAEEPRTAASSRRDAASMDAHGVMRKADYQTGGGQALSVRERNGRMAERAVDDAQSLQADSAVMDVVETKVGSMCSWTWAPLALAGWRADMLTCLGPTGATCMLRGVCHDPPPGLAA